MTVLAKCAPIRLGGQVLLSRTVGRGDVVFVGDGRLEKSGKSVLGLAFAGVGAEVVYARRASTVH